MGLQAQPEPTDCIWRYVVDVSLTAKPLFEYKGLFGLSVLRNLQETVGKIRSPQRIPLVITAPEQF